MVQKLDLQLWSIQRDTAADFAGALAAVAGMGYIGVEFAGYGGLAAAEMKRLLDANGLRAAGSHVPYERLRDHLEEELEYNAMVGNRYLICPGLPMESADEARQYAAFLNECGETCRENGFYLGYHNHAHELVRDEGTYLLDILREQTHPHNVFFELDVFWVAYAGVDVSSCLKQFDGRLPFVHLKQIGKNGKDNVVFGEGALDFRRLIQEAHAYGAERFVVEHEEYGDRTPMECVRLDIEAIKSL